MDPATARMALKLQLDDVDAILKAFPPNDINAAAMSEKVAFSMLGEELVRKWQEVSGQYIAYNILKEENNNRAAFKRLLSEEQQAERDHDMACRLAGKPVPQRAPPPANRSANDQTTARQNEAINGPVSALEKLRFDLSGTQTAAGLPKLHASLKRAAEEQLTLKIEKKAASESVMASKQATVEDVPDAEAPPRGTLEPGPSKTQKRVASLDPVVLRERDDGRTKRLRHDMEGGGVASRLYTAAATKSVSETEKAADKVSAVSRGTCSSCLDMHPMHDMLQLPCKDENEPENHAYCRDCLQRLFQSSVTDPSHFPPRCCNRIIPLFSCTPFLTQPLIAKFVERREELGTSDRTYCSNNKCSKWVRPADIQANVGTCAECKEKTCATCKGKQHGGLCPEDKDVKELMSFAKEKRWQTCPNCKEMVELERGCYHITCRCRHQFCYLCVTKWKTCNCPLWDERNIINPPQPGVAQAAPAPAPAPAPVVAPFQAPAPLPAPNAAFMAALNHAQAQLNAVFQPAPVPAPQPAPQQAPQQAPAPRANNRNKRRRNQRDQRQQHEHHFERFYRSNGWNTTCHKCGHQDRWVNCCSGCDLKVCWYCTKNRV
ncbi:hypothetical protein HBH95_050150 [Parastagonospora nodorum]|nr:hypothetical protein HBI76_030480 [Parastagonospora nodorum]KAH5083175.1 hypothetical protein HBH95_050150 [Parastagonospora nodorum]